MPPPMTSGHVTGPVLIWQSDRLVVAVRHVVAFPVGVEVEVEAHSRGTGSDGGQYRLAAHSHRSDDASSGHVTSEPTDNQRLD
jgi:hypothetical protein